MAESTARLFAIRGYMKSGTNWLCNLLNLHPEISCIGEFHWERVTRPLVEMQRRLAYLPCSKQMQDCSTANMQTLIASTIRAASGTEAQWCGDRTPGVIDWCYLPQAKFFDIVRDGRDVVVSRAFHLLRRPETTAIFEDDATLRRNLHSYAGDPHFFQNKPHELLQSQKLVRQTARSWANTVAANYRAREERPDQVFSVRYEDLHSSMESIRAKLYEFLELDPNLAKPLTKKTTPGFDQERPQDLYRKGAVGEWRTYFTDEVHEWFADEAAETMSLLGYE